MYDAESESIGDDIEKYTLLNMTTEEMVQTAESAPVTLTSLAGAFLAAAGTAAATKNPQAAANAAAITQATIMGLAVNGQEYMSTFDDPNFYDYFKDDVSVPIEEAVEVDEFGELVVKEGYTRKHDPLRAAGYANVAAFSEFAGEFIGNKVIIGGAGFIGRRVGVQGLGGRLIGKAGLSKGVQRAARYATGLTAASTLGALVEGEEERYTEYMQSAARKEYSNQDASGLGYFRNLYASIIDPDEELKKNARIARNSGVAMGVFLPIGVTTATIVQNERQIRAANDALRQNKIARDQINKKNETNFGDLASIDEQYFGSDAEFIRYEENRQKYLNQILKPILSNKGIIMAGMSKDERKLYNQEMKKLDKLFKTVNQDGQVDLEAIAALLPSIASKIDVLRDKIGVSQNIANDLIKLAQQGNLEATEMLFSIMKNQVELRAMVQARLDPNVTEDLVKTIDEEIKNLEKRNSELIVKAYKQAEGKGFQYTFVDDPQSASEATGLRVFQQDDQTNSYTLTYKNAEDLDPSVDISEQGVVQEGGFTLTEVGDAATVVTADNIDDFGLETKQADRLRELIAASPNARVIIHEGQESLDAAGARANMTGKNAFTLQDKQGRVFEIHLKQDFALDVADEEFLHFEFNEELYKDEVRQPMIASINKAIQKNPNSALAEFVRAHNARMAGNSQKMIEIELLTNLGRVIARQEEGIGGEVIKAKDVESVFDPDRSNFRPLMKRFDKYLKGRGPIRELSYDPSQVDNEGDVEGTAASYKPTFLDGKTVRGHLRNSEFSLSTTEVSAKIKDYNHYRNWYAKMTGNNKRPIRGLYYVDDNGQNVFIRTIPGHEKTDGAPLDWTGRNLFYKRDYKTKEIINMEPVPLTYGERQKSSFRREQEQRDARRQSQLARRQNLNAIAMNEYGKNIYNLASEVPGVQPLGYRDEFTQEEIELMEVYIAEKLGIVPVSAKRMTLPVPRVPRDMSGDIVEGTASSRELGRISYDFNNKAVKDILEKYGAETIDDLDIRQLSKDEIPYQLAVRLMGYTKFHVFEEGYAGMAPEVSIPRLSKQGRVEPGKKRETKSGAIHLMNMPEETIVTPSGARMPVINIAANSVKAIGTKVRQAALDAQADGAALVIPYMSLSDNNVFSDEAGFKVTMEWLIDNVEEWGDQELRLGSGKQTSSVVDQIAIGINSAIAGTESSGDLMYAFRLSAVKMAMADAKVSKYPFVENWSEERGVDEFGDPDITTNLSSVAIPTLQPEARSVSTQLYDPNVVKDALKLLIRMSDQYASDSYSNLKFGMRERVATSILSSISRLRTPESNSAAKRRPYIFTDQTKSVRDGAAATYVSEQLRHPDAYKGGAHVYAVVRPEAIVDVSQNNEETYRYVVKAKSNKAFMFRSRPEFNLDRESIEAAFPEVVDERGKKLQRPTGSTLIELNVEGTANSRRLGRISYVNGSTWQASDPTSFGKALDAVALKLQDKYADIMMLQKDIEEFRGRRMAPGNDFNLAVDLMYGKTRNDLDGLDAKLDAIKEQMRLDDIKSDDLSDFVYAMHARERNAFIQSRRPDMESGSGMTNDEAEAIIDRLGSNEMRRLHGMVMDIVKDTRKTMLDYGLETADTVQNYEDMYEYYIPLSGQAVDETSDEKNMYPTGGIGMAVYGPTTRKAKGRSSKTGVNVVAQAVMQNARVKQLARKNEALQSLHSMFAGNPNEDVVTLWSPQNRMKTIDEKGKERKMTDSEMRARGDMVPVRINGEQHFDPTNILTRVMRKPAQWLRNVFTVYDPNFFVTNFSRDIQSALYNALAEAERTDGTVSGVSTAALTKEVLQNTALSLRGLLNENAFGREMDPVLKQFYEEWKESGGQTGWGYTKDIDQIIKDLDKDAKAGLPSKVWKSAENVAAYIEGVNEAFENSIRLSAYISARKLGVTKDRAAQLSKNVTVNFNRSGEWGSTLNSVYLFFNAAMQGNARILRSLFFLKDTKKPNGELESWHKRVG
jgi:hypothetical protein